MPILQGLCLTSSRATWAASDDGLSPLDVADPGRDPGVRRADHHGAVLVQGDRRRRAVGLRRRPGTRRPGRRDRGARTPGCGTSRPRDKRIVLMLSAYPTKHARIGNAVGLDTPARAVALLRAMGEAGLRRRRASRRRRAGRRRADPRPDRGRRPGPGLAHRGTAGRQPDPDRRGPLPRLVRRPCPPTCGARVEQHWGPAPGELYVDDGRHRPRRAARRERPADGAAAARFRGEPGRDLPRPGPAAVPPLPGRLPLAGRPRAEAVRRRRDRAPRQARQPGVAARQDVGMCASLRHRRGARRPAAGLPVPGQRPGRGHAGQAPRARHAGRPPDPADGPGRVLRRHRPARATARRARQHRRARPGEAARDPPADLDADAGRPHGPRPGPGRPAATRT